MIALVIILLAVIVLLIFLAFVLLGQLHEVQDQRRNAEHDLILARGMLRSLGHLPPKRTGGPL